MMLWNTSKRRRTHLAIISNGGLLDKGAAPTTDDGGALTVLVVEDNLDFQGILCDLLGLLGHKVRGVPDAEQALKLLITQDFDILVTDVSLPGMSGIVLAQTVLSRKHGTRIIFSTGYGLESIDKLGFEASFLRKPYDMLQLKAALGGN